MNQRVIPLFPFNIISNFAKMKLSFAHILLIFSFVAISSQGVAQSLRVEKKDSVAQPVVGQNILEDYLQGYYSQVFGFELPDIFNMDLYSSIEKWLGTPYRYAGKTDDGIDCSSFVNRIYESVYCYMLPSSSADIAKQVTGLPKEKLREGDLVFFKINRRNISHVGVYLGDDKFAHASQSKGVIISDLNSPYYKKYFVKAGRVNFPTN